MSESAPCYTCGGSGRVKSRQQLEEERRLALCGFVRAHGFSPDDVPMADGIEVYGDKVTITVIERDENGNMIADGDHVRRKKVTVAKVCELP